jgi:PAS domain S-box-containing protein
MFEQSLDLICVAGVDGYLKRLNPTWTQLLDWSETELLTTPFLKFVHADDLDRTRDALRQLNEGKPVTLFENRFRHRRGVYFWLQWNAASAPAKGVIYASARDVTRQKWLEREFIRIADREKEHLGRELHDGLCQSLAGISALSATLARSLSAEVPGRAAEAAEVTTLVNEALEQIRNISHDLAPTVLERSPLDSSLKRLAIRVEQMFGVQCKANSDGAPTGLPADVKVHLFRIAQEAVHNPITHGRAREVVIEFALRRQCVLMVVRDNGIGIAPAPCEAGGIGLKSMEFRANLIGGSLDVRPGEHGGAIVTCEFPVERKELP